MFGHRSKEESLANGTELNWISKSLILIPVKWTNDSFNCCDLCSHSIAFQILIDTFAHKDCKSSHKTKNKQSKKILVEQTKATNKWISKWNKRKIQFRSQTNKWFCKIVNNENKRKGVMDYQIYKLLRRQ